MEAAAVIVIIGFAAYMLARSKRTIDFKPPINKKEKLPLEMSDSEYIERVMAENNEKERVGKMAAANHERIKKDYLWY